MGVLIVLSLKSSHVRCTCLVKRQSLLPNMASSGLAAFLSTLQLLKFRCVLIRLHGVLCAICSPETCKLATVLSTKLFLDIEELLFPFLCAV
jgi:hypothetical protein